MTKFLSTANPKNANFVELHESGQDFGDFYPVGYIFAAFPDGSSARKARISLLEAGWSEVDCRYFEPETVRSGSQKGLDDSSVFSSIGATLKMVELHRDLAAKGCHFLLIHAPTDEACQHVMTILNQGEVSLAQRYRRLIIETLAQNDPLTDRQK